MKVKVVSAGLPAITAFVAAADPEAASRPPVERLDRSERRVLAIGADDGVIQGAAARPEQ